MMGLGSVLNEEGFVTSAWPQEGGILIFSFSGALKAIFDYVIGKNDHFC